MSKEAKFFECKVCGNMVGMIYVSGAPMTCCGQQMSEMVANTVDASYEKHLPVVSCDGSAITVAVGSTEHPMIPEHFIGWIYLQTEKGGQRKSLAAGDKPEAKFVVTDDDVAVAAFAYCNLHGLWKTAVE
ncbi:MAG: desulfoferrodoxin family protein [Clostridia bacterium]